MKLDLLVGLTEITGTVRGASRRRDRPSFEKTQKFVVDVIAPEFPVDFDDQALAEAMAQQLVGIMQQNMMAGLRIDGTPAPPISQATIERREYRLRQDLTGGQNSRYSRKEQRKQQRNFKRRYKATKLGKFSPATNPAHGQNLRGIESGLLLKSFKAEPNPPGWRIYFANIRAIPDRSGIAPIQRAFGVQSNTMVKSLMSASFNQSRMKKAAKNALKAVVLKQKTTMDLLRELRTSLESVQQLAQTEIE